MIDTSGHHIVYGELHDFLTGETLPGGCERHFDCPLNEALVFEREEEETWNCAI